MLLITSTLLVADENLEEAMRVIPPKHLKKVVALKTLALKVAAHLKWNMSILEKG